MVAQPMGQVLALALRQAGEADFFAVLANCGDNVEGERECAASVTERHDRRGTLSHCMEKRSQLRVQRFFRSDRRLAYLNLRIDGWSARSGPILAYREDEHLLPSIVDRDILPGLEEAQLAHALRGNAAGREVSHASRFELQPHIGDVHFAGENRDRKSTR